MPEDHHNIAKLHICLEDIFPAIGQGELENAHGVSTKA